MGRWPFCAQRLYDQPGFLTLPQRILHRTLQAWHCSGLREVPSMGKCTPGNGSMSNNAWNARGQAVRVGSITHQLRAHSYCPGPPHKLMQACEQLASKCEVHEVTANTDCVCIAVLQPDMACWSGTLTACAKLYCSQTWPAGLALQQMVPSPYMLCGWPAGHAVVQAAGEYDTGPCSALKLEAVVHAGHSLAQTAV